MEKSEKKVRAKVLYVIIIMLPWDRKSDRWGSYGWLIEWENSS